MKSTLFIFGLGYSSLAIAHAAMEAGFAVSGTCRTQDKCTLLSALNIHGYVFDQVPNVALAAASHVLSSVPTVEGMADPVWGRYGEALRRESLWRGYLSTTGVYGDHKGGWVDETTPVHPNNERLKRRVEAEKLWLKHGAQVFRLAGIYGPGRSAIDDVLDGAARRIDKPGQVFSRVHVEDIAQVVLASMQHPQPGAIYNVCDDEPTPAHEVVSYAAQLLGKNAPPMIPFEQAELSAMGREFYSSSRRVRNERIKNELGVVLRYPTYREGLWALLPKVNVA